MEINREEILNSVLETIKNISSKDYQKRTWILGEGSLVDDFDETCCNFFGDVDPLLEKYADFGLNKSQYLLLKNLRDQFRAFSDEHYWPADFLDSPEWAKIMEMAREVLEAFNYEEK